MKEPTPITVDKGHFNPFSGPTINYVIPITLAQEEIWMACKLGGDNANRAYNESISLVFKGKLDVRAFSKALDMLISRHQSLRAAFSADGRFMSIFEEVKVQLNQVDFSDLKKVEQDQALKDCLDADAYFLFDLVNGPLLKTSLIKIADQEHQFVLTAHHIICDGWSFGILLQELGALYSAHVEDQKVILPIPQSFSSYAEVQQELLQSSDYQDIESFWLKQFEQHTPQLELPTDFPRPKNRTYDSARLDFQLETELVTLLKKTATKQNCSLVTTLLAAFEVFLYQQSNQNTFAIGLPAAGQAVTGKQRLIGHCANLLPLYTKIDAEDTFIGYLKSRKSALLDAYDHQQLSFGHLLKKIAISRDPSRVPLVPVIFNIDLGLTDGVLFTDLNYTLINNPRKFETFEIFLNATGSEDRLVLEWSYNKNLFKPETITQMMASFDEILRKILKEPAIPLNLLLNVDKNEPYALLNATAATYPNKPLHELLAEKARTFPQYTALRFKNEGFSYKELYEKANQFAHYLIGKNVKPGDTVALALPRCAEIPVALIAILQCGANYLPLDPTYPVSRLQFMVDDAGAQYIVTTQEFEPLFKELGASLLLENILPELEHFPIRPLAIPVAEDSTAYIIYTSGSTGTPKGVRVTHKNLVNFLYSMLEEPGIKSEDNLLSITTISFDIAGLELFLPLLCGATLVIAQSEVVRDGRLLLEMLSDENISIVQATPSTFKMLLDSGWKTRLSLKILCGGEPLSLALAKGITAKSDSLWNMYGPTETTIWSTLKKITEEDESISIGKPIANTQIYLVDDHGKLVGPGQKGEILIAGDGVSLGYWKKQELTNEKFIKNTFDGGPVLYRTGDLGVLLPSGEIQCLGRLDHQVKIRGHRIELGEIEQAIVHLTTVKTAVVLSVHDVLVAFVVVNTGETFIEKQVRESLLKKLPVFMVPQVFNVLDTIPLTLNGKVDRTALLAETVDKTPIVETITLPRTEAEEKIAVIWKKALNLEQVDIFSNFFELGGHSLIAVQVMSRIEEETGKRLPLSSLFEYSTIEKLAQLLDSDGNFVTWDSLVPIKPSGSKTPLYIVHGGGLNVLIFNALARNMDREQPVYGLQAKGLDGVESPLESVEEIAAHYIDNILQVNPRGPYALAGYSFGGVIAYEMARQLMAKGKKIKTLVLLDTYAELAYYQKTDFRKRLANAEYLFRKSIYNIKNVKHTYPKLFKKIDEVPDALHQTYLKFKYGSKVQHELKHSQPYDLDLMNKRAMRNYQLRPQDVKIDLLRAKIITYYMHDMKWLGWKPFALKGVEVHEIPGEHSYIFSPPHDKESARILQQILDKR